MLDNGGYGLVFDPEDRQARSAVRRSSTPPIRPAPFTATAKSTSARSSGIWYTLKVTDDGLKEIYKQRLSQPERARRTLRPSSRTDASISSCPTVSTASAAKVRIRRPIRVQNRRKKRRPTRSRRPTKLQIVPCESLLRPGDRQEFSVRLYNVAWPIPAGREARRGEVLASPVRGRSTSKATTRRRPTAKPVGHDRQGRSRQPEGGRPRPRRFRTSIGNSISTTDRSRSPGSVRATGTFPIDYDLLKSLEAKNPLAAAALHLSVDRCSSTRAGRALKFDNNTPQQTWTELLRYLDLIEKATYARKGQGRARSGS